MTFRNSCSSIYTSEHWVCSLSSSHICSIEFSSKKLWLSTRMLFTCFFFKFWPFGICVLLAKDHHKSKFMTSKNLYVYSFTCLCTKLCFLIGPRICIWIMTMAVIGKTTSDRIKTEDVGFSEPRDFVAISKLFKANASGKTFPKHQLLHSSSHN